MTELDLYFSLAIFDMNIPPKKNAIQAAKWRIISKAMRAHEDEDNEPLQPKAWIIAFEIFLKTIK